ncbi:unnamed protein product [Spirodela intermedia]|uniref:Uncharacterized protein n=1 Tax=Spirodela intermedia TaxID=51605 RepID=A0A7I8KF06_SPIIN|nr:unnamed protein product [Spirodela intermedia]
MRQRCTRILSVQKNRRAMSMASKALVGQGRCGQLNLEVIKFLSLLLSLPHIQLLLSTKPL